MPETAGSGFVDDYLAYLLARASHLISSAFHDQVRAAGLSVMEWRVMASLSEGPALSIKALSDIVLAQQPTVTKLVGRMVTQGWVVRTNGPDDKRQTLVTLTSQGRHTVAPLLALAKAHEQEVFERLGSASEAQLKTLLRAVITSASPPEVSRAAF